MSSTLILAGSRRLLAGMTCDQFVTKTECLYAPEPRCSWEDPEGGEATCECAINNCKPVDFCFLEADSEDLCNQAILPNAAPCVWDTAMHVCKCEDPNCRTRQPSCESDTSCEEPCDCVDSFCQLVDECYRFEGPTCEQSEWKGRKCCPGYHGQGCFLCDPVHICKNTAVNSLQKRLRRIEM